MLGGVGRPLTLSRAQDKVVVTDWCCDVCDSRAVCVCGGGSSPPRTPQCECAKPSPSGWSPNPARDAGEGQSPLPPPPRNALNRPGRLLHVPAARTHS